MNLIDTDGIIYRACTGCKGDFLQTIETAEGIRQYIDDYLGGESKHFLTGKNNFRYRVAITKPYKGNRKDRAKPRYLSALRDYVISEWDAVVANGCEADDLLGIHSGTGTVIVTNDKDLDQIPGRHFNWVTGEDYDVGERAAEFYLMKQMLTGDVADNIPGIPGMGEKKAFALLSETEDLRSAVIDVYKQTAEKARKGELILKRPIPDTYKDWTMKFSESELLLRILRSESELKLLLKTSS